ncbi:hypothetical protein [Mycobacterium sp.]|uniref:hypothetical protein n=1 Tax=Mycobacterium sp. TaxID=1785 RepID=UPI002C460832|nr:hypothetical protein [Mycobacterium sp.]HTH84943.1 hypothetical protein [Mycobacterium sp.]
MVNAASTRTDEGQDVANAIYAAALTVGAGDVILLDQQTPRPNYPCSTDDQCGLVAVEYDEVVYAAITWATASGIVVVESAGNGHQNLDAPEYGDTFNTATGRSDSGAIIVGAGASPADCEQKSGRPARSRLNVSNYGEFVDIQGWGECSSAVPIVAGAAAAYSSATEATIGTRPTSWQVRQALVSTGTPQDTTSQNALEGNIGPLPNLLAALALIGTDADITPPTVTAPVQTIAMGKAGSTVPIRVRWSATDAGGIKAYELWRSTNAGKFVRDTTLPPTATSRTYLLTVGKSYRFFVRAHDNAGNTSVAKYGPTFTPTITDDRSGVRYSVLGWGSWKPESSTEAYMGTLTKFYSMQATTRATLGYAWYIFTGRDVAYVASLRSDRTGATVKIDGITYSTVNLYRSTSASAQIVVSKHWATSGTHTIEVGSAGYGWIDVDAFVVNK